MCVDTEYTQKVNRILYIRYNFVKFVKYTYASELLIKINDFFHKI